jgi:hypothetical protein
VFSPAASLKKGRMPNPLTFSSSHLLSFPLSTLVPELVKNLLGRADCGIDLFIIVGRGKKKRFELGRRNVYALLSHALIEIRKKIKIAGFGIIEIGHILICKKHPEHGADMSYSGCDTGLLGRIAKTGDQPLCTIV